MIVANKYKIILILGVLILLFLEKCYHFDPDLDDFDESIIPTLSEFSDIYNRKKETIYGGSVVDYKIYSLCDIPENLKKEIPQELITKLCKLEKRGKVQRVELRNECVNFNIKVYKNSIFKTKWLELTLVHDDNFYDDTLCANDLFYRAVKTKKFKDGWILILYTEYANWRG